MGSPFYMAPEQWSDDPPDARADIYSLGVMLFQMLAGQRSAVRKLTSRSAVFTASFQEACPRAPS
jgi:serine/threonine protein kinase